MPRAQKCAGNVRTEQGRSEQLSQGKREEKLFGPGFLEPVESYCKRYCDKIIGSGAGETGLVTATSVDYKDYSDNNNDLLL